MSERNRVKKHSVKLIAGIAIAALLVFLLWNGIAVDDQLVPNPIHTGPETEMLGVSTDSYSSEGDLLYKLSSDSIAYEKERSVYQISNPIIWHFDEDAKTWKLRADQASVETKSTSGELLVDPIMQLRGEVSIEGPTGSFRGTSLTYNPSKHTVSTPYEVSIDYDGSSITAEGMKLDLQTGTYELNTGTESSTQSVMKIRPRADRDQSE